MIGLLQRVSQAEVLVDGQQSAVIGPGLLVFIGVEKNDTEASAGRLLHKLLHYRVFADAEQRMNLDLKQTQGQMLLVPQFTLPADTAKGLRPGFSKAAPAEQGNVLFNYLLNCAQTAYPGKLAGGRFGADMQVSLINDGPVTFWLQVD